MKLSPDSNAQSVAFIGTTGTGPARRRPRKGGRACSRGCTQTNGGHSVSIPMHCHTCTDCKPRRRTNRADSRGRERRRGGGGWKRKQRHPPRRAVARGPAEQGARAVLLRAAGAADPVHSAALVAPVRVAARTALPKIAQTISFHSVHNLQESPAGIERNRVPGRDGCGGRRGRGSEWSALCTAAITLRG
jgi:hypothetical protein